MPRHAPRAHSALAGLLARPQRYRFDAALRVLAYAVPRADSADVVRFRAPLGMAYAAAEVVAVRDGVDRPLMTTPVMALTGPTGVLPRHYGEILHTTVRNRSNAMQGFLELLSQRFIAHFARAGTKYRPHRAAEVSYLAARTTMDPQALDETIGIAPRPDPLGHDPIASALMAFIGFGTPHLVPRLEVGQAPLLHYAGLLSMRPRSADRLSAMLSDWLGRKVEVVQFIGDWLSLPLDQRTRMPLGRRAGAFNRLGVDAAIGVRAWDVQGRVLLRIGPLDAVGFASLHPDRALMRELVSLTRAFLGLETGFAVNPVIAADAIPGLQLGGPIPPPRLGWNSWLPAAIRHEAAADAVFTAEMVEAETVKLNTAQRPTRKKAH